MPTTTGPTSFTFTVDDGSATSAPATVSITVDADNDAPVADDDSVSVTEDVANTITLAGTDADGDTLSFAIGTGPTHGSLGSLGTVGCSAGTCSANVTYTPDANYHRSDSFTFTVDDGSATSAPATVSITVSSVNDAPVADDDAYSTAEGQALSVDAPGVLVGDTDADGDQLSAAVETDPTHGTLVLQADGSFTYTPSGSFSGQDSFTYQASDGQAASNVATVTITVTDVTHAPVAQAQSVSATEGAPRSSPWRAPTPTVTPSPSPSGPVRPTGRSAPSGRWGAPPARAAPTSPTRRMRTTTGLDSFTFTVDDGSASQCGGHRVDHPWPRSTIRRPPPFRWTHTPREPRTSSPPRPPAATSTGIR